MRICTATEGIRLQVLFEHFLVTNPGKAGGDFKGLKEQENLLMERDCFALYSNVHMWRTKNRAVIRDGLKLRSGFTSSSKHNCV